MANTATEMTEAGRRLVDFYERSKHSFEQSRIVLRHLHTTPDGRYFASIPISLRQQVISAEKLVREGFAEGWHSREGEYCFVPTPAARAQVSA